MHLGPLQGSTDRAAAGSLAAAGHSSLLVRGLGDVHRAFTEGRPCYSPGPLHSEVLISVEDGLFIDEACAATRWLSREAPAHGEVQQYIYNIVFGGDNTPGCSGWRNRICDSWGGGPLKRPTLVPSGPRASPRTDPLRYRGALQPTHSRPTWVPSGPCFPTKNRSNQVPRGPCITPTTDPLRYREGHPVKINLR